MTDEIKLLIAIGDYSGDQVEKLMTYYRTLEVRNAELREKLENAGAASLPELDRLSAGWKLAEARNAELVEALRYCKLAMEQEAMIRTAIEKADAALAKNAGKS